MASDTATAAAAKENKTGNEGVTESAGGGGGGGKGTLRDERHQDGNDEESKQQRNENNIEEGSGNVIETKQGNEGTEAQVDNVNSSNVKKNKGGPGRPRKRALEGGEEPKAGQGILKRNKEDPPNGGSLTEDGFFPIGSRIWCPYRGDNTYRLCKVIERHTGTDGKTKYYVHYVEFNRRMDTWVAAEEALENDPAGGSRKQDIVEFVEEDYGDSNAMDEASIREHEEITKIKNVDKIELGRNVIHTWYYSPIPREFFPDGPVETLYMSEFTLDFYRSSSELARHYKRCQVWHPPGDEIYRDEEAKVSFFEVDGAKSKVYAQNLSYLAKFFLDHKTLHYDVDPFLFYVLCEFDDKGHHIVGFFSKEKYSELGFNLACILTLPPYQRKGYGKFLISFSYELSKKEKKVGSPEKPLSDLGQISYRSYWSRVILEVLATHKGETVSILELTAKTSIKTEDVILALKFLGLVKYVNGRHVLCVDEKRIKEMLVKLPVRGPQVDPEKLHWAPLKVDVKRDKWSIKAKKKPESANANQFE